MPKVGDKEFSYTPEGVEAAKEEAALTGEPLENTSEFDTYDASQRSQNVQGYQEGGGTPEPTQYAKGGEVPEYFFGGAIKAAGRLADRAKKAITRPSQWREWKPGRQRGLGLGKLAAGALQGVTNTSDPMYDKLSSFEGESLGSFAEDFTSDYESPRENQPIVPPEAEIWGLKKGGKIKKK